MSNSMTKAAQCAMACQNSLFQAFLRCRLPGILKETETWPWVKTKEDAATAVRYLIDIDSRREIDTDPGALQRWNELDAEFEFWKRDL